MSKMAKKTKNAAAEEEIDIGLDPNEGAGEGSSGPPFYPLTGLEETVVVRHRLKQVVYDPGAFKGACYRVVCHVLKSSATNVIPEGVDRTLYIKIGTGFQRTRAQKELRHVVAAVNQTNPEDKEVDYKAMLVELVMAGEDLEDLDLQLVTEFSPGNDVDDGENGERWTNRYHKPAAAAEE